MKEIKVRVSVSFRPLKIPLQRVHSVICTDSPVDVCLMRVHICGNAVPNT